MFHPLSNEITHLALESRNLVEMFNRLADRFVTLCGARSCSITTWDAEKKALNPAWITAGTETQEALRFGQAALDEGRVLGWEPADEFHGNAIVELPLIAGEQKIGAVVIIFPGQGLRFTSNSAADWKNIADQIALATQRMLLLEQNARPVEVEVQPSILPLLTSPLNLGQVCNGLFNGLAKIVTFDTALIALIEDDALQLVAGRNIPTGMLANSKSISPDAAFYSLLKDADQPVILADARNHPSVRQVEAQYNITLPHLHSWMGVPLVAFANKIGYLTLTSGQVNGFDEDAAHRAASFARQAAIVLENARLFEQVRHSRERLQILSKKLVEVQEAERRRLSHELHDEIGQSLTALQFTLEMGKRQQDDTLQRTLVEAQEQVSSLMNQVRELSIMLRPSVLDDLGLLPALCWLFDRYHTQTGIQVHFTHQAIERRFQPDLETSVFRLVQEALTNIARYAGVREAEVSVILDNSSTLSIQIRDQGRGFDPAILEDHARSFGITGMYERTNLAGGIFEIITRPGQGTCITAIFPIDHQVERRRNDRESAVSG